MMEIEEIGSGGRRLEERDCLAPMVPAGFAEGEIVAAREPGEIRSGDQSAPGDIFEVAWELGPKRGF
jgi:hypothetical protein